MAETMQLLKNGHFELFVVENVDSNNLLPEKQSKHEHVDACSMI